MYLKMVIINWNNLDIHGTCFSNTGGFVPKRTSVDNYIPLHGTNYFDEKVDDKVMASNSMKSERIFRFIFQIHFVAEKCKCFV